MPRLRSLRLSLSVLALLACAIAWAQPQNDAHTGAAGTVGKYGIITAAASANRTSCTAPCSVHFDATGTTKGNVPVEDKYLALDYRWDFGDPSSGTWARGARYRAGLAQSRNVEYGFEAAHVFEAAGTYVVKLLVTDGILSDTLDANISIVVASPDTTWSGTNTICVGADNDPTPGSGGCPAGAAHAQNADFDNALTTTCNIDSAAVRCLFEGGDTFTASTSTTIENAGPAMIGAFGTGKANVTHTATTLGTIRIGDMSDLRIVDLAFTATGIHTGGANGAVYVESTSGDLADRILLLRLDITGYNSAIYTRNDYPTYNPATHMHSGWAIVDVNVNRGSGQGGNDYFLTGHQIAVLGSAGTNKLVSDPLNPGGEHVMRVKFTRKSIFAHGDWGLTDGADSAEWGCAPDGGGSQGNTILKFVAGFAVDLPTPSDGYSGESILADNYISKCRFNVFDVGISPTDDSAQKAKEHHEYWVVEGNHFVAFRNEKIAGTTSGRSLNIASNSHVVVRNNVCDMSMPAASIITHRCFVVDTNADQTSEPGYVVPTDVRFLNNTCYQDDTHTTGTRHCISNQATDVTNIVVSNNLLYDVDIAGALVLSGTTNTTCCGGSCNGSCNLDVSTTPFSATPGFPSLLSQFAIGSSSAARGAGVSTLGVVARDAVGDCRNDSIFDVGAREYAASPAACAGP